ncbi:hypothetical protein CYLTODRAFT_460694, partial [Cylindrobasidium torrendii FP15055 ss-10]
MARASDIARTKPKGHVVLPYPCSGTIWGWSFLSITVDEMHAARGDNKTTDAFDAITLLAFFKWFLTATPVMQSAADIAAVIRLLRPANLTEQTLPDLNSMKVNLKRLKRTGEVTFDSFDGQDLRVKADLTRPLDVLHSTAWSKLMVLYTRIYTCPHTVRVTRTTLDNTGKAVSAALKPCTTVLVSVKMRDDELAAAASALTKDVVRENPGAMGAKRFGEFFLPARQVINVGITAANEPHTIKIPPKPGAEFTTKYLSTKLRAVTSTVFRCLTEGPEA